jgi:hypothetical protein
MFYVLCSMFYVLGSKRLSQNPFVFLVNFSRFGGTSLVRFVVKKN